MIKRWVLSLWLASALAALNCHAQESGSMEKYLTLEQAGSAEFVAMWLREKGVMANRKDAELFFEWGMQDKRDQGKGQAWRPAQIC